MKRYGKAQSRRSKQADRYVPRNTDDLGGADAGSFGAVAPKHRRTKSTPDGLGLGLGLALCLGLGWWPSGREGKQLA